MRWRRSVLLISLTQPASQSSSARHSARCRQNEGRCIGVGVRGLSSSMLWRKEIPRTQVGPTQEYTDWTSTEQISSLRIKPGTDVPWTSLGTQFGALLDRNLRSESSRAPSPKRIISPPRRPSMPLNVSKNWKVLFKQYNSFQGKRLTD